MAKLAAESRARDAITYVGTHPTGRRYYRRHDAKRPALAFAVFVHRSKAHKDNHERWEFVGAFEDREYPDELVLQGASWVRQDRPLTAAEAAEQHRLWFVHVANYPPANVAVVPLRRVGAPAPVRLLAMFLDYTGLPRAWGCAETAEAATDEARRQLERYCARQRGLEPDLADPDKYELRVELVKEDR